MEKDIMELMELTEQDKADIAFLQQVINKYKTKESLRDHFFYHYEKVREIPVVARITLIGNFIETYKNLVN